MRRIRKGIACSALVLLLVACGSGGEQPTPTTSPDGDTATGEPTPTGPAPDEVAVTSTVHLDASDIEVEIYPLVRSGDHVVLTLDLHREDAGADKVMLSGRWGGIAPVLLPVLAGLRLFDLERDVVHTVATDADSRTVTTGESFIALGRGADMRLQTVYAAPPDDVTSLGLFLPGGPYVPEVPVVDGDVPAPDLPGTPSEDATDPLDLAAVVDAPVAALESFTRELEGAVQTLTSTEEVRVTLGSDVLFAVDSADLTPDAEAALDVAADHLSSREPGTVHVVGHTDDVMDDAYNQDLSERRADAVAAALADRIDTGRFDIQAEGRGESEPLVDQTDDESRARNRRVELTLVSQITETVDITTEGELPDIDGPVGTGADGVQVESGSGGTYLFRAPEARRVDGHLVLDLQVTAVNEAAQVGVSFLDSVWHYRPDAYTAQRTAAGLVALRGGTAFYPLDYLDSVHSAGNEQWLPATDLETLAELAPDATRTYSVIYPDIGDIDEIAVQVGGGLGARAFRLTDIPVR